MGRIGLYLAVSQSNSLVWASEAHEKGEHYCPRCGCILILDVQEIIFVHPKSQFCSARQSLTRIASLYLRHLLDNRMGFVAFQTPCPRCERMLEFRIEGTDVNSVEMLDIDRTEAILVSADKQLLLMIRPCSRQMRDHAKGLGVYWGEVDARNVIFGNPILLLESNFTSAHCAACNLWEKKQRVEKIKNPYELIG